MKKLSLAAVLMMAVMALGAIAQAHDGKGRGRDGRNADAREYGQQYGYEDGFRHGRNDRLRRIGYRVRSDEYRRADRGYERWMGARGQYRKGYREGYHRGYDAGYGRGSYRGPVYGRYPDGRYPDRYPDDDRDRDDDRYPERRRNGGFLGAIEDAMGRNGRYGDVAYERGFREGQKDGLDDGKDRDRYDPYRHGDYKDADDGYHSSYGSKQHYRANFRQGYLAGYEQGYRQYSARW